MKVYNYVLLAALLMVFFQLAGIDTSSTWMAQQFGINDLNAIATSSIWLKVVALFAIGTVGAVAMGIFTSVSSLYAIKASIIMAFLLELAFDFIFILNQLNGWSFGIASIIMIPLIYGYIIAMIEFWEGRD